MRFAVFSPHLPRRSESRSYEVLHLSRKIILGNLKISCSKMEPFAGNRRPNLLTCLMNMSLSLALRLPREMHVCRFSSNVPPLPFFATTYVLLTFGKVQNPLRLPHKRRFNVQKWSEHVTLYHFHFHMCFVVSQPRALFPHLNFQKCSERGVFCTFRFQNVLRTTMACNSHLSSPQMAAHPPTFRPFESTGDFVPFAHLDFLSSFLFSDLLSSGSLFSDSAHLCCCFRPYCRI